MSIPLANSFGWAWAAFAIALGVHVTDEALNDFLTTYNASIRAIRRRIAWAPFPTFQFGVWLSLLAAGVALLLALTPLAFARAAWLRAAALPLGVVVGLLNGAGHLGSSLWLRRWMPGAFSSPLLLVCGAWLIASAV